MRSQTHRPESRSNPVLQCMVEAVSAVADIFLVIGDLLSARSHTKKKSDRSEPPDDRYQAVDIAFNT